MNEAVQTGREGEFRMCTKRRRVLSRLMVLTLIAFVCASAFICTQHTGQDCASLAHCPLCQLILQYRSLTLLLPFSALLLCALCPTCFGAHLIAGHAPRFSPLVFLHVQLND